MGITSSQYRWLKRFQAPPLVFHIYLYYRTMVGALVGIGMLRISVPLASTA